jgi:pimeloyl-ACP methyl ester carboxylesterase
MNIYFISGIGADRRIFKYILLPPGFSPHYIDWIPNHKDETLSEYAARLIPSIDATQPFVLIGLSLGGIMAVEIAKRLSPAATIIIASVSRSSELPPYYRLARRLHLLTLFPPVLFKCTASAKRIFTPESWADKRELFNMIWKGDAGFIKWGMKAVLHWENDTTPQPFWHIHGTRDEVFPVGRVGATHIVNGGGHVLTMSHPNEVNQILNSILNDLGI